MAAGTHPGDRIEHAAVVPEDSLAELAELLEVGLPTLQDILDGLLRPGRDPRDDLPAPVLRQDVLSLDDLVFVEMGRLDMLGL